MKVALCFIINYEHILYKENIWREWIEPNRDIINVYFYYNDLKKIKSKWIMKHTIPPTYIHETSYFHVIPAYLSVMSFALQFYENNWFCLLTDSCCPIISPTKFRYLFYNYYKKSVISWKPAWWNIEFHKRANLNKLPKELHLANDPWFVMQRENVLQLMNFVNCQKTITKTICNGGLANESLFAIILYFHKELNNVLNYVTHITDWERMATSTSPHLFQYGDENDKKFIEKSLDNNKFAMFIRKISPKFPDEVLRHYIYDYSKENDDKLILKNPFLFKKIISKFGLYFTYGLAIMIVYYFFFIQTF